MRAHEPPPGASRDREASWDLTFATADASFGGFVRLTLRPGDGVAWWWTGLAGSGRPYVLVRDHEVEPPSGAALEIRSSGLWAEITEETPGEHWSFGLEAFAVALDDPADAWGDEMGQPVAVGLDIEWEAADGPASGAGTVHGEVLVGSERIDLDAYGWRRHIQGDRGWWTPAGADEPGATVRGHLDDGTPVAGTAGPPEVTATVVARAPILVTGGPRRSARLDRALCRLETTDGRRGSGWVDSLSP